MSSWKKPCLERCPPTAKSEINSNCWNRMESDFLRLKTIYIYIYIAHILGLLQVHPYYPYSHSCWSDQISEYATQSWKRLKDRYWPWISQLLLPTIWGTPCSFIAQHLKTLCCAYLCMLWMIPTTHNIYNLQCEPLCIAGNCCEELSKHVLYHGSVGS